VAPNLPSARVAIKSLRFGGIQVQPSTHLRQDEFPLERQKPLIVAANRILHFFAERKQLPEILLQLHPRNERAPAALAERQTPAAQGLQRLARGHPADSQSRRYFLLPKALLARFQFAGTDLFAPDPADL